MPNVFTQVSAMRMASDAIVDALASADTEVRRAAARRQRSSNTLYVS